jgi:hypothetical protein
MSFVENVTAEEIQPFMEKHDLIHPEPNAWYPAQKFLNVLNDLATASILTSNLVSIGMAVISHMVLPPELENAPLPAILNAWGALYKMQHRGSGDIGWVKIEKITDTHYKAARKSIYPEANTVCGRGSGW